MTKNVRCCTTSCKKTEKRDSVPHKLFHCLHIISKVRLQTFYVKYNSSLCKDTLFLLVCRARQQTPYSIEIQLVQHRIRDLLPLIFRENSTKHFENFSTHLLRRESSQIKSRNGFALPLNEAFKSSRKSSLVRSYYRQY